MPETFTRSDELIRRLREAGREWGPLGVALAAAELTDRDLLLEKLARLRKESTPSVPYPTKLPFVSMDEDGTMYFAEGHVDPWRFLVGVLCDLAENCGPEEVMGVIGGEHWNNGRGQVIQDWITGVKYSYYRVSDEFGDRMEKCSPSDDGAMAYTQIFL